MLVPLPSSKQLTFVMRDTLTGKRVAISHDYAHLFLPPLFLFAASPFCRPPHTLTHTSIIPSFPTSPCARIYIHTSTKMDQFHILFQDAEDAMSHCQFMARSLSPHNAAMQMSCC